MRYNVYLIFANVNSGFFKWMARDKNLKHLEAIISDGQQTYTVCSKGATLSIRTLSTPALDFVERLLRLDKITMVVGICVESLRYQAVNPFLLLGNTCNEQIKRACGINLPLTTTVANFYKKLKRYDNKRNYKIFMEQKTYES